MNKDTAKKTRLGLIACATTFVFLGSTGTFAGEITGNGKDLRDSDGNLNGRSECAFSGQQDDAAADAGEFKGDRTQSWGQLPNAIKHFLQSIGFTPGVACNPKRSGG
jgi:hypothetical protein